MTLDCNLIKDLMPSYIDKICCKETEKIVEEHIQKCSSCKLALDSMQQPISHLKLAKEEQLRCQNPFIKIRKKNRIKNIIVAIIATMITIICMMIIQNVGVIHKFFFPQELTIVTIDSEVPEWRSVLFEDDNQYLIFDSFFCQKKITNNANSTDSIKIRILDEEGLIILDDLFVEPGKSADLRLLKYNTKYKVEVWSESGKYILNFY